MKNTINLFVIFVFIMILGFGGYFVFDNLLSNKNEETSVDTDTQSKLFSFIHEKLEYTAYI